MAILEITNRRRRDRLRHQLREQTLALILNELRVCLTLCESVRSKGTLAKRTEYEEMARKRLGRAVVYAHNMNLNREQSARFTRAFRELAAQLPISPLATVTYIDDVQRSA